MRQNSKSLISIITVLVALAVAWLQGGDFSARLRELGLPAGSAVQGSESGAIDRAFAERRSGLVVEDAGRVVRLLPDDNDGSRHQRFVVQLESGLTVLIAHNIDLAPRVDGISVGDTVRFSGEYEWNERGGVIHWTHHDPKGLRRGGWIAHDERKFE